MESKMWRIYLKIYKEVYEMNNYAEQLRNEILEKNKLINYFNQKHDVNKSKIKSIELNLTVFCISITKPLRTGISRGF